VPMSERPTHEQTTIRRRCTDWQSLLRHFAPLLARVLIVALTASHSDRFLGGENITNILRQHSPVAIIAIGMALVIILGGIDLLATYLLLGVFKGIAALIHVSGFNSVASSNSGALFELDAIAAVVVGGMSMRGGPGTIPGTMVGVLILGVMGNMLDLLNVSPYLRRLVKGAIITGAALLQRGRSSNG